MENQNPDNQLQIELKEEVAQGTYANLAIITHLSLIHISEPTRPY